VPAAPKLTVANLRVAWPDGCLAVAVDGKVVENDERACDLPRRPYSTFKLANALIGLDTGVLTDADSTMTWDAVAVPRDPGWSPDWTAPMPLRRALAISAVPMFRTLALELGDRRMANGLAMLRYGNQSREGGLDRFWLGGGLRISARQQLAFVDALAHGTLSATSHAQAVVREISELARADDGAVLYGKTGTGPIEDAPAGEHAWLAWQVGWVERPGGEPNEIVPYAAWLERRGDTLDAVRAVRAHRLDAALARLGMFTPSAARVARP
jgi:beta-lactamase class D